MSQQNLSDHLINVKASLSPTNTRPSELERLLIDTESKSESKSKSPLALAQPPPPSILPDQIKTETLSNDQIRGWSKTTPPPPYVVCNIFILFPFFRFFFFFFFFFYFYFYFYFFELFLYCY